MLLKFNPALILVRQRAERNQKALSKTNWINADRMVMITMFVAVVVLAIAFA